MIIYSKPVYGKQGLIQHQIEEVMDIENVSGCIEVQH